MLLGILVLFYCGQIEKRLECRVSCFLFSVGTQSFSIQIPAQLHADGSKSKIDALVDALAATSKYTTRKKKTLKAAERFCRLLIVLL